MNPSSVLTTAVLVAMVASTATAQQPVPIALNYNWNGIVHAGEAGVPDDIAGFRSVSDRALDFTAGVPVDALLDKYTLISAAGALDIVHLGDRRAVGVYAFDATADGDNIGVQPAWLANPDQSGPQTSVITPVTVLPTTEAAFIYQISNGGGSFDVTFTFMSGGSYTGTLSGPDWFMGAYPGTQNNDTGDSGTNLSVTEGRIDLSAYAGEVITEVTFENRSNVNGGYAILAGNFENAARHTSVGSGCYPIDERASWHQTFANSTDAELGLENQTLLLIPNGNGGHTTIVGTGTLLPGNPASLLTLTDDSKTSVALPAAFNYRGTTAVTSIDVHSKGYISMGPGNGTSYLEVANAGFFTGLTDGVIAAYAEDLNPGNGGTISTEYDSVGGIFYITFEGVPHFSNSGAVTFQYQLELASGLCTIVYGDITPETGTDIVMVGEAGPGATVDTEVDIFTATFFDTYAVDTIQDGVILDADVPAISTATTGTTVVYSVAAAPDFSPTFLPGTKVGLFIASFAPLAPLPGLDLGFLGAAGCPLYVTSLDFVEAFDLAGTFTVPYPAGIPPQTTLFFQAAMLFDTADPAYATTPAGINGNTFTQTSNALITVISNY